MTVIWTRKAYDDLDGIEQYFTGVSDEIAESTVNRIQAALLRLD